MFAKVKLIKGFSEPLFYKIPENWVLKPLIGTIIQVPLKKQILPAIIQEIHENLPLGIKFEIKTAISIEPFPEDANYQEYIKKISALFFLKENYFYKRIKDFLFEKEKQSETEVDLKIDPTSEKQNIKPTEDQQKIIDAITPKIENPEYMPSLIHGVTGSGKTEIYKELILKALNNNKSVIFLIPEVSLSLQFQKIFKAKLPQNTKIFGFHSATKLSEKRMLWENIIQNKPCLIIGVHLPILLPISNLGLIIVDEEHEANFQEKKSPKLNSKIVAIYRANIYKIPIILGSATPSVSSIYNAKKNGWKTFELKKRFIGQFPTIQKVLLKTEKKQQRGSFFWISRELEEEIKLCLAKKEQALIFLNRRGYSFFILCKECGFIFECPNCSVSLTLHVEKTTNHESLNCHYCSYKKEIPHNCPKCKKNSSYFLRKGIGTQQVVYILGKLFPLAKIARADMDSTKKKREWQNTVNAFEKGEIDILVGTQTITKGYHFPNVTLVGILWGDSGLQFPKFNAIETNLQQLIQVAGRAGRSPKPSKVILQIIHENNIFNNLAEENYFKFYKDEIELRELTQYPPAGYLVQIEFKNISENKIDQDSSSFFNFLEQKIEKLNLSIQILGPSKPEIHKLQKIEIRLIYLKSKSYKNIQILLSNINLEKCSSSVFVNPIF